jgi:hypothetical protein
LFVSQSGVLVLLTFFFLICCQVDNNVKKYLDAYNVDYYTKKLLVEPIPTIDKIFLRRFKKRQLQWSLFINILNVQDITAWAQVLIFLLIHLLFFCFIEIFIALARPSSIYSTFGWLNTWESVNNKLLPRSKRYVSNIPIIIILTLRI